MIVGHESRGLNLGALLMLIRSCAGTSNPQYVDVARAEREQHKPFPESRVKYSQRCLLHKV